MILALVASSMLSFFQDEVYRRSTEANIPTPTIVATAHGTDKAMPWAWIAPCAVGFECNDTIFIRMDVLNLMGFDTMRVLALHEVLHLKYADNAVWGSLSEKEKLKRHQRIWDEIERTLDADAKRAARAEANWWRRRWAAK